jgi:PAS domain S-box-containing protein
MAAATFIADPGMDGARDKPALAQTDLALGIATTTFVILLLALVASAFDRKLVQRSLELDEKNRRLRQANDELMAVYEQGLFASHLNMEGRIVHTNRAAVEDLGFAREDIIGKRFWEAGWWQMPKSQERIRKAFERAAAGTSFRGEVSYLLKDGTEGVTDIAFVPIKDEVGRVMSVFVPGTDITDRARQYRATFENAAVGIAHLSTDAKWLRVNRTFARIIGYSPDELVSKSVQDITHPDDLTLSFTEFESLRSGKADSFEMEKRYMRRDGTPVWVHITGAAVRRNDGSVDHFVTVIQDVSERKRAEEQVRLLLREMNHRGKNILSLVQAVARQTAVSDPEHFMDRFTDRIQAIAANQDLLVRASWRGVDVDDLVCAQLAHFSDLIGYRISLDGPQLRLNGAAAQAIGMVLHELATNASKYGALSTDVGHVDIAWRADGDLFTMNWTERDGPPVRPPDRRGFGTTVLESMAKHAVDGAVQLEYDTAGVAWHLTCPATNALEPSGAMDDEQENAEVLNPKRVTTYCQR